ncbi:MAG: ribbon-helix-helix protein, CopG family [Actinobacteria bacterium]|nr:MAG: ribbon-helix-helix protein, CopG family [Actinomycetota bacterium]
MAHVNVTERTALLDGLVLHDELRATVDDKTLEILERRRRTAVIKGRGWLVRRMLLAADLAGLVVAMARESPQQHGRARREGRGHRFRALPAGVGRHREALRPIRP